MAPAPEKTVALGHRAPFRSLRSSRALRSGSTRLLLALLGLTTMAPGPGCGIADLKRHVRAMDNKLVALHSKVDKQNERIETLSNQLFILEDRVDSNRVALKRRPGASKNRAGTRPVTAQPDPNPRPTAAAQPEHVDPTPPRLRVVRLKPRHRARKGGRRMVLRLYGRGQRPFRPLGGPAVRERIPVVPIPSAGAPIPPPGPIQEYRAAYRLYTTGQYARAAKAFSAFAARHPHHDYADNAIFWMGQCLYKQNRFKQAAAAFRRVLKRYPSGNKAPDSLLKLGLSLKALGAKADAKRVLTQVVDIYPNTRVARIATKVLGTMR